MARTKFFVRAREEGSKRAGDCGTPIEQQPDWYDQEKMLKAAEVYHDYSSAILYSHLLGTIIMSQVPSLLDLLLATGQHDNLKNAEKRGVMTTYYVRSWYSGRVQDKDDQARKNLKIVRAMHSKISKKLNEAKPLENGRVWLSEYDMALTQFAFIGALVLKPKAIGFHGSNEEIESVLYYWRYIGYLLGMEDQYNMCAGSYEEVKDICLDIVDEVVKPCLSNPQPFYTRTIEYAFKGYRKMGTGIRYESVFNSSCDVLDFPQVRKKLTLAQVLSYWIFVCLHYVMSYPGIRKALNAQHKKKSDIKIQKLIEEYKKGEVETKSEGSANFIVKIWNFLLYIGSNMFEKLRKEHDV